MSEFDWTEATEIVPAQLKVDDAHYDVVQHLEGDFPGGAVDLHYRFTLRGASIARLVFEP